MIHEQKQHKQKKHIKQQTETNNNHGKRNVTAISTNIKQHPFLQNNNDKQARTRATQQAHTQQRKPNLYIHT